MKRKLLEAFCSLSSTEMQLYLYFQVLLAERQLLRWPRFTVSGQKVNDWHTHSDKHTDPL